MITDALINLIYNVFMFFLGGYEPLHFNLDTTIFRTFSDFFAFLFYILPIKELLPIVTIIVSIMIFRIIISVVKTIWDLLPIL